MKELAIISRIFSQAQRYKIILTFFFHEGPKFTQIPAIWNYTVIVSFLMSAMRQQLQWRKIDRKLRFSSNSAIKFHNQSLFYCSLVNTILFINLHVDYSLSVILICVSQSCDYQNIQLPQAATVLHTLQTNVEIFKTRKNKKQWSLNLFELMYFYRGNVLFFPPVAIFV